MKNTIEVAKIEIGAAVSTTDKNGDTMIARLDEIETSMLIEDLIKTLPETNEYRRVMEERFGL